MVAVAPWRALHAEGSSVDVVGCERRAGKGSSSPVVSLVSSVETWYLERTTPLRMRQAAPGAGHRRWKKRRWRRSRQALALSLCPSEVNVKSRKRGTKTRRRSRRRRLAAVPPLKPAETPAPAPHTFFPAGEKRQLTSHRSGSRTHTLLPGRSKLISYILRI